MNEEPGSRDLHVAPLQSQITPSSKTCPGGSRRRMLLANKGLSLT
jgi:hypothetical protein